MGSKGVDKAGKLVCLSDLTGSRQDLVEALASGLRSDRISNEKGQQDLHRHQGRAAARSKRGEVRTGDISSVIFIGGAKEPKVVQKAEAVTKHPVRPPTSAVLDAFETAAREAMVAVGSDRVVFAWNDAAERLLGRRRTEAIGSDISELIRIHGREDFEIAIKTALLGEPVTSREMEMIRLDGMPVPVSVCVQPVLGGEGEVKGCVLAIEDTTEKRLAQATLAEIESRVRESEKMAGIGSWLWDVRTGSVQWSVEFHHIHGVDPLSFEGTLDAHLALLVPSDRARVRREMEAAVSANEAFRAEYQVELPNGQKRTVMVLAQPTVGATREVVGLRGIGQEVKP